MVLRNPPPGVKIWRAYYFCDRRRTRSSRSTNWLVLSLSRLVPPVVIVRFRFIYLPTKIKVQVILGDPWAAEEEMYARHSDHPGSDQQLTEHRTDPRARWEFMHWLGTSYLPDVSIYNYWPHVPSCLTAKTMTVQLFGKDDASFDDLEVSTGRWQAYIDSYLSVRSLMFECSGSWYLTLFASF